MAKHEQIELLELTKEQQEKIDASIRREEALALGMYDGRLRTSIFVNRRKKKNKQACRGKVETP